MFSIGHRILPQFGSAMAIQELTASDLRTFDRTPLRTAAEIFVPQGENQEWSRIRAWTDDLSPGGAKLVTERLLPCDEFYVRVCMPELLGQLFLCRVARKGTSVVKTLSNLQDIERHTYGVEFMGVVDEQFAAEVAVQAGH